MIRSFSVKNFRSIKDKQVVDLVVSRNATDVEGHFRQIKNGDRVPIVVAVYGHNGSGKTCMLQVPLFISNFINNSFRAKVDEDIPITPFLSPSTSKQPTEFEISFDLLHEHKEWITYRYHLILSKKKVFEESLYYRPKRNEKLLFARRAGTKPDSIVLDVGPDFDVSPSDPMKTKVTDKASVISTFAQFNHKISRELILAATAVFSNVVQLIGRIDYIPEHSASHIYSISNPIFHKAREFMRMADLGIEDVALNKQKIVTDKGEQQRIFPTFKHRGLSNELPFSDESHGTQALYRVLPYILSAISGGGTAIIDELDADIHPMLMPRLLDLFHSKTTNPHRAQFFLSGHNPYTLSHLHKEEVFFTEKNMSGETRIFGLKSVKGVRRSDNYFLKYISGAYGAIPK